MLFRYEFLSGPVLFGQSTGFAKSYGDAREIANTLLGVFARKRGANRFVIRNVDDQIVGEGALQTCDHQTPAQDL